MLPLPGFEPAVSKIANVIIKRLDQEDKGMLGTEGKIEGLLHTDGGQGKGAVATTSKISVS